jgi:hypothetical protein
MKEAKKRYFPCPYCKGEGYFVEDTIDYWDITSPCGYCEGEGLIEIGGEVHMRRKYEKAGLALLKEGREYSWQEVQELGKAALASQNQRKTT